MSPVDFLAGIEARWRCQKVVPLQAQCVQLAPCVMAPLTPGREGLR
jgi:hypothetical protein